MTTMTEASVTWLDVMPALPLARGVPVRYRDVSGRIALGVAIHARSVLDQYYKYSTTPDLWRVDLDDEQGFGYALRWLDGGSAMATEREDGGRVWADVLFRHLAGKTTDADRLALAKALAEVSAP